MKYYYDVNSTIANLQMNFGLCMASGLNEILDFMQKINHEIKKQNKIPKNIKISSIPIKEEKIPRSETKPSIYSYWDRVRYNYHGKFNFHIEKKCTLQILTHIFPYSSQNLQVFIHSYYCR